jgi:hypothetical protein
VGRTGLLSVVAGSTIDVNIGFVQQAARLATLQMRALRNSGFAITVSYFYATCGLSETEMGPPTPRTGKQPGNFF